MKTTDLTSFWDAPDNSRVTSKQYSLRLPVHVAAKINALCEMYPQKNRTAIIGDLLTTALDELEQGLPIQKGEQIHQVDGKDIYEDVGLKSRFRDLANKHYHQLENELGNETPSDLFSIFTIGEEITSEDD